MASDFLLSLQAEWGDENTQVQQSVTIRNVIAQLKLWLKGEPLSHLPRLLQQMRDKVNDAAQATQNDLKETITPELEQLIRASLQDYVDMEDFLGELARGVAANDPQLVRQELAQLSAAANALGAHQEAIDRWIHTPVLRCPRCGSQARGKDWTCSSCNLEMLYSDPKGPGPTRTLNLGEEFKSVHDVYVGIVKGEQTLSRLAPTLPPLRELLQDYALLAGQASGVPGLPVSLDVIESAAKRGLIGVSLLEGVPTTRQTRDLHEGWRLIFDCAGELQGQIPAVAKALGQDMFDVQLQAHTEDAVFLTNEED